MNNLGPRWLKPFRRPTEPAPDMPMDSNMPSPALLDQILKTCSDRDEAKLGTLLDEWHGVIMKAAVCSASIGIVQQVIDRYGTNQTLNQTMLKESAQRADVDMFNFFLIQQPSPSINDAVRLGALDGGGVDVWKAIWDSRPELIEWDFGEKGDMIGMAVMSNNTSLLSFLLERGFDPNEGRVWASSAFDVATKTAQTDPKIRDLLITHGATAEKSMAANKAWRGI